VTGKAVALDHVGAVGRDLVVLTAQYERLGFTLTLRALAGGGRIANRCVMLRAGYLELTALAAGGSSATLEGMLMRHAGAHIIALAVDDAAAAIARLRLAGIDCPGMEQSNRPIDASDPANPRARFAHVPVPQQPEARVNLILHLTPELLWQERFMDHPNHVVALEDITLIVPSPAETAAQLSRLAGRPVVPGPEGGYALTLSSGRVRLLAAGATAAKPLAVPSIIGITLRTDDARAAVTRMLTDGAIPHDVAGDAVITRADVSGGVSLHFT
jgi:4-hydroxyphenylpyruvate dioxygenase-like putative hemolysin